MSATMSAAVRTDVAAMPRVNLLPPEIAEAVRLRKLKAGLALVVLGAVAGVGALYMSASSDLAAAEEDLAAAEATTSELQAEVATYAQVPLVQAQVETAQAELETAMGEEVRYSYLLNDLSLTAPGKLWLSEVTVTQTIGGATTPGAEATGATIGVYGTPGIASVAFAGQAMKHDDVAEWLDALAKQAWYSDPHFSLTEQDSIGETAVVTHESQVVVTDEAYSKRYVEGAGS